MSEEDVLRPDELSKRNGQRLLLLAFSLGVMVGFSLALFLGAHAHSLYRLHHPGVPPALPTPDSIR